MKIDKSRILEALRARGLEDRAVWAERELPDPVDTSDHAGILATLKLDPADFVEPAH